MAESKIVAGNGDDCIRSRSIAAGYRAAADAIEVGEHESASVSPSPPNETQPV